MLGSMDLPRRLLTISTLWVASACHVDAGDFSQAMVLDKTWKPEVTAPEGADPAETRLYQLLYAGEFGPEAQAAGQRVRMTGWLRSLELSGEQLVTLASLGQRVQQESALDRRARAEVGAREAAALTPIYAKLEAALVRPEVSTAELEALSLELAQAREAFTAEHDPRTAHRDRVRSLVSAAGAWMAGLSHEQRVAVGGCRFVLLEQAAPLTNPGSYASMVGMIWDRGDFSALQAGEDIQLDDPLDLGGLWALEHLRAPPSGYMLQSARDGMLLLALMDPAFLPSMEGLLVARGMAMPELAGAEATPEPEPAAPPSAG